MIDPLQLDPLWQSDRENDDSPEAKLVYEIILQAWKDSNSQLVVTRHKARAWFYSPQFKYYCGLLNINTATVRSRIIQSWKNK